MAWREVRKKGWKEAQAWKEERWNSVSGKQREKAKGASMGKCEVQSVA